MYIYVSRISLVDGNSILNQLYIDILRWTIGFFGSIIMIILGKNICNKFKGRIVLTIAMFGKISLGIYIKLLC